jgi:hypothetical protein
MHNMQSTANVALLASAAELRFKQHYSYSASCRLLAVCQEMVFVLDYLQCARMAE